ncbi:DNA translocase FtsK 4TM domain-containing protein, partial [bacterium]|nr:DNA translocase FtsK 4TM domain-containing protein [bacterium]
MFKYGSFRNFVIKSFLGIILFGFGLIYLASLYSYSQDDPGFSQLINNTSDIEIENIVGLFGAYLSSYSLIFIGTLSYLLAFFITLESVKLFLGIINRFVVLRFLSNILGIFLVNVSLRSIDILDINRGLISQFIIDIFSNINLNFLENTFVYFFFNFVVFILGILLILLSFRISFSRSNKLLSFLKLIKYLRFILSIFVILKYFKFKKRTVKKTLKSEPTIKKRNYVNLDKKVSIKSKSEKQLELGSFSFSLPPKNLLSKSNHKNNKNKELDKINTEAALRLEKTLSEYGVDGKIIGFSSGPIVTLFEFIPNAGIKSSKVIGLSDDIARAMSSISARISTQPGKTSLG